jgi:hypothetical protein
MEETLTGMISHLRKTVRRQNFTSSKQLANTNTNQNKNNQMCQLRKLNIHKRFPPKPQTNTSELHRPQSVLKMRLSRKPSRTTINRIRISNTHILFLRILRPAWPAGTSGGFVMAYCAEDGGGEERERGAEGGETGADYGGCAFDYGPEGGIVV